MRFGDIGLSARITFWALLLVVAGGLLWMNKDLENDREGYLRERSADLKMDIHLEQARLAESIGSLRQDVLFLASLPSVSGIVRASANNGVDPRDKSTYAEWEARLQDILAAFLRAHPEYCQASYIGAAGEGRELVRVESRDGHVVVAPHDALKARGDRDYFKAGLMLTAGRVYLSEFAPDGEPEGKQGPQRLVLHAVTTVFDANGRVFGMVVIDKNASSLFASVSEGLPPDVRSYVADQFGHFLFRPGAGRAAASEPALKDTIAEEFLSLKPMLEPRIGHEEPPSGRQATAPADISRQNACTSMPAILPGSCCCSVISR